MDVTWAASPPRVERQRRSNHSGSLGKYDGSNLMLRVLRIFTNSSTLFTLWWCCSWFAI